MKPSLTITEDEKTGLLHGEFITQDGDVVTFKGKDQDELAREFFKSLRVYTDFIIEQERSHYYSDNQ